MQLPKLWKAASSSLKLYFAIFFFVFSFFSFYLGYRYSKTGYKKPTVITNSVLPSVVRKYPTTVQSMIGKMGVVPVDTKYISYRQGNSIYLRNLTDNKLSDAKNIATANNPINDYVVDQGLKYVAYTYFSNTIPEDLGEMSGGGDEVVLKDITTGTSKIVLSHLTTDNLVASLSFSNNSKKLFIGLDNDDIYSYSINDGLLAKIYSDSKSKPGNYCRGYDVIDESPNGKHIIVNSRCFEGTTTSLYNISSKAFTQIGGGYIEGTHIIKFLDDNEIYGFSYGENVEKYLKINLWGGIIQELPKPTDIPKPLFGLYDDYQTKERFIADESKSRVPNNVDFDSRQIIGTNAEDIFFYPSP